MVRVKTLGFGLGLGVVYIFMFVINYARMEQGRHRPLGKFRCQSVCASCSISRHFGKKSFLYHICNTVCYDTLTAIHRMIETKLYRRMHISPSILASLLYVCIVYFVQFHFILYLKYFDDFCLHRTFESTV
jgi:phosphoglycerol transferase MdoB-like AlkP superfamily enzyme